MTIKEAVDNADALKPNAYTEAQKVAWLSELDTSIYWKLVRKVNPNEEFDETGDTTYNTGDIVYFYALPYVCLADGVTESPEDAPASWQEESWDKTPYDTTAVGYDEDAVLLCPVPYDIPLYTHWLCMQISLYNREILYYNNEAALFNAAWTELANHLHRSFTPVSRATHFQL